MLVKVELLTADFKFVHKGWMPKFNEYPSIILWGNRSFKYHANGIYLEAFAYSLINIPDPRQSVMFEEVKK